LFDPVEDSLDDVPLPIDPAREYEGALRFVFGGMLAQAFRAAALARMALLSYPLSARRMSSSPSSFVSAAASVQPAICPRSGAG